MKQRICFLLITLLPTFIFCQAPGYVGKKTILGFGIHTNPVIYGSTANNKTFSGNKSGSAEAGHILFNLTYDLFAERVISTKWLFGNSIKFLRTGYDNRSSVKLAGKPTDYYQINALTINPYFKHYFKHAVAPWGGYFLIGPSFNLISTKHDNYMFLQQTIAGHDTLIMDFGAKKQKHFNADLLLGVGKNRIFKHKIILDYGFNFHALSIIRVAEAFDAELLGGNPSTEEYIELTSKSRLRNATCFNLFLRIGYLF